MEIVYMLTSEADFRDKFKTRFNELRGEMTQAEFAEHLGISRPTVGFYENGDRIPDALTLRKIASKCNVTADYLLGITNTPIRENVLLGDDVGLTDKAIDQLKKMKNLVDRKGTVISEYEKYYLRAINLIITDEENNFLSPIVGHVVRTLAIIKELKERQHDIYQSLEKPWRYDELKEGLEKHAKEELPNESDEKIQFSEWKMYKGQQAFAHKIATQIFEESDESVLDYV